MLFIVKPTAACNGKCVYCSAYKEDPGRAMTRQTLRLLFERVGEYAETGALREIQFLWHGGEPLLMGPDFYREVLELSAALQERGQIPVGHLIQSNITLVTEEFLPVLKELVPTGRFGTSYDPIPGIRLLRGGKSYEEEWKKAYALLRSGGLDVGVVYVVHHGSLGNAGHIYHELKGLGLTGGLRFNPLYDTGLAKTSRELHISPRQWGEFLLELWEVWNEDGRTLHVAPLEGWDDLINGRKARLSCAYSGSCTRNFTGIDADGTVYTCGRSMDDHLMPFGNLHDEPLSQIYAAEARRAFLNRQEWLLQGECAGCRWWSLCHGGCPNDAQIAYGDMLRKTYWCEGTRLYLDRIYGDKVGAAAFRPEGSGYEFDLPGEGA